MYTIKCDDYILHYPIAAAEGFVVSNPKCSLEANKTGSAAFKIFRSHPYYNKLQPLKSVFEISDEYGVIFRGRMTEHSRDFLLGKSVDIEGAMAYFNDSIVRPFSFPGDFLENADYIAAEESGNVIAFFLQWLIDNHNSQVQPFQRFKLGTVTVSDANNYLSRSSTEYQKTWETLRGKLFESTIGGYLCIRYESDGNYIDYLSDFPLTNTQKIEYGKNLLDWKSTTDAKATYSAIIPIGAEVETTAENEDGTTETEKHRITLSTLADGNVTDDIVKSGDTLYSKSGVSAYGWIYAPISDTTWDDVTEPKNLQTKGTALLANNGIMLTETQEMTAADLHFSDAQIRSFRVCRYVQFVSAPHGQDISSPLVKLDIDMENPQNTKITIGQTRKTLIEQQHQQQAENAERIESVQKDIAENRQDVTDVHNQLIIQQTQIINTCNSIIMSALQNYVETSDHEKFRETVESQMKLLADQMTLKFTETTERIESVNGDLQAKFNTITKYFTFDINGLTIGRVDNPYRVVIDNDRYSMFVNNTEVLWFDADGKGTIPELSITRLLNLLGLHIDKDESGNVNCEMIGG